MKALVPIFMVLLSNMLHPVLLSGQHWERKVSTSRADLAPHIEPADQGFLFEASIGNLYLKEAPGQPGYFIAGIPGYRLIGEPGAPEFPSYSVLFESDPSGELDLRFEVLDSMIIDLSGSDQALRIRPAGEEAIKIEPEQAGKAAENEYSAGWQGNEVVRLRGEGVLRGVPLASLNFSPVRFHPGKRQLKVYTRIRCRIITGSSGSLADMENRAFRSVYRGACLKQVNALKKSTFHEGPLTYLILSDTVFRQTLQPFITWKTRKGYKIMELYIQEIPGNGNNDSIRDFLTELYHSPPAGYDPPSYLLIAGDEKHIPVSGYGTEVTDLYYAEYDGGGDYIPDLFYGRLSVSDTGSLHLILDKILRYEQYAFEDPGYLDRAVFIAGVDYEYAPVYGNGQLYYLQENYFPDSSVYESYFFPHPESGSARPEILSLLGEGAGLVNYTGHGDTRAWLDPEFNLEDAGQLENRGRFSVFIGNGCKTNRFTDGICLAESLLLTEDRGAVGYIGCTNDAYWKEDYDWACGCFDGYFHTQGQAYEDWAPTLGEMLFSGNMAVQKSTSSRKKYYWEIYQLAGDPSVGPWIGRAKVQEPVLNETLVPGQGKLSVFGLPFAYLALTLDGHLVDARQADKEGLAELSIPDTARGTLDLLITAQGYQPYQATVEAGFPDGIYLSLVDWSIGEESFNGDGHLNPGETCSFNLSICNRGTDPSGPDTLVLRDLRNIAAVLEDTIFVINGLPPGDTLELASAFSIKLPDGITDRTQLIFSVGTADRQHIGFIHENIFAPELHSLDISWDDRPEGNGNAIPEAGEMIGFKWRLGNSGQLESGHLQCISALSSHGDLEEIDFPPGVKIPASQEVLLRFNARLPYYPLGSDTLHFRVGDGYSSTEMEEVILFGRHREDFEYDQPGFPFESGSAYPWRPEKTNLGGVIRSGPIPDRYRSDLSIWFESDCPDSIVFRYRVSSEKDYDFLECYLDDSLCARWSGNVDWTWATLPLDSGSHRIRWSYVKDRSLSEGQDAAWIDDVIFPSFSFREKDLALMDMDVAGPFLWLTGEKPLEFRIRNCSAETVDGFTLSLSMEGSQGSDRTFTSPVHPGKEMNIFWDGILDLPASGTARIEAEITSPEDRNFRNNRIVIDHFFPPFPDLALFEGTSIQMVGEAEQLTVILRNRGNVYMDSLVLRRISNARDTSLYLLEDGPDPGGELEILITLADSSMQMEPGEYGYTIELLNRDSLMSNNLLSGTFSWDLTDASLMSAGPVLKLYPNPAMEEIHLLYRGIGEGHRHLEILDMQGRVRGCTELPGSRGHLIVPVSHLQAGVYFLNVWGTDIMCRIVIMD